MYIWAFPIAQLVKNLPAMQDTPVRFLGQEDPLQEGQATHSSILGLPCGSGGKEFTCNVGDLGLIPGWEDPLEKGMATHASILAWRIPWTVQSMESQRVRHDSDFYFLTPTVNTPDFYHLPSIYLLFIPLQM